MSAAGSVGSVYEMGCSHDDGTLLPRLSMSGLSDKSTSAATSPGKLSIDSDASPYGCRTVIIFDWDDTLLCSSTLRMGQIPTPELMGQLERAAESFLLTAMSLGETLIVTNGTESWVPDSAARFLPGLVPVLKNITTISARARHEQAFPDDPFAWKREAFRELLGEGAAAGASPLKDNLGNINLVVIGDSWYEIEAARSTMGLRSAPCTVKTLKFKEVPTIQDLLGQIRKSTQDLHDMVSRSGCLSWGLSAKSLPAHLECLIACASAWEVTEEQAFGGYGVMPQPPSLRPYLEVGRVGDADDQQRPVTPLVPYEARPSTPLRLPPGLPTPPPLPERGATVLVPSVEPPRACGWVF